jgi:hypothetical protein
MSCKGQEYYKGRPIVYSLGNFIFGGNSRTEYETAVLKVSLKADRQMKVEFLPVEVRRYQARIVRGRQGDQILSSIERLSRIFDQPMYSPIVLHPSDSPVESVDRPPTQPTAPNLPKLSTSKAQSIPAQPNIESLDIATILPPKLKALAVGSTRASTPC